MSKLRCIVLRTHMFQVAGSQRGLVLDVAPFTDALPHGGEQRRVVFEDVLDVTEHGCKLVTRKQRLTLPGVGQNMLQKQ